MKYIIAILITLVLTVLSVSAQDKQTYKDYTPCTECFEQWKISEGRTGETPAVANREVRTRKPFRDTYVGQTLNNSAKVIVGTTLMIFTAVILTKATKPTVQ